MADETEKKEKSPGWGYKTLMATIGTGLLMFFANLVWNSFESNGKAIEQLSHKLEKLEADQARWGLLTDLHNQTVVLERRQSLHENDVKWLRWALEQHAAGPVEPKTTTPRPLPVPLPVPPVTPKAEEKLFKPEDLKKLYEQKHQYPNPAQTPKK